MKLPTNFPSSTSRAIAASARGSRSHTRINGRALRRFVTVAATFTWATAGAAGVASATETTVKLGTATSFAILAATTVTNTGASTISGSVGLSPGSSVTGFPPATVTNGNIEKANTVAAQARADLTTAYLDAAGRSHPVSVPNDLGGQTLVGGLYKSPAAMQLTGTVTLNGAGNPSSVFIFQTDSSLTTAPNSSVRLIGGAQACNVFWQVGSSAVLDTGTVFAGTVMALTSITLNTGALVKGRVLARNGEVSLHSNVVTRPSCTTSSKDNDDKGGTGGDKEGSGDNDSGTPIPGGAPDTGFGGMATHSSGPSPALLALPVLVGAAVVTLAVRRKSLRAATSTPPSDL